MKLIAKLFVMSTALVLVSCAGLPRVETRIGVTDPASFAKLKRSEVIIGQIVVEHRTFPKEIEKDVYDILFSALVNEGFKVVEGDPVSEDAWSLNVRIVERNEIKGFTTFYASMITISVKKPNDPNRELATFVRTQEYLESMSSPFVLRQVLETCIKDIAAAARKAQR